MSELDAQERGCITFAIGGPILSAAFYTFGFVTVAIVLNEFGAPPLVAVENFGQFGFLAVYVGFFGGLVGAFSWVLVLTRWSVLIWIPLVIGIRAVAISLDMESLAPSFKSVILISQICLDLVCVLVGALISVVMCSGWSRETKARIRDGG